MKWPLPPAFPPTGHIPANLPGFPAKDVMAPAGDPVYAPVGGTLVYVHDIPWSLEKRVGGRTAYLQGDNGKTYFLTHMAGDVPSGRVEQGQQIGTVAAVPHGWWDPHIHEGVHQGIYNPPGAGDTTRTSTGYSSTARTSAATIDAYLRRQGSPLAGMGSAFVYAGAKYGVDPALLVAIAGGESTL